MSPKYERKPTNDSLPAHAFVLLFFPGCVTGHELGLFTSRGRTNTVAGRGFRTKLPLRSPQRGSGQSYTISGMVIGFELPAPASATAPAKDGFGNSRSACPAVLTAFEFIVRLRRLRCLSLSNVHFRMRNLPSCHPL